MHSWNTVVAERLYRYPGGAMFKLTNENGAVEVIEVAEGQMIEERCQELGLKVYVANIHQQPRRR